MNPPIAIAAATKSQKIAPPDTKEHCDPDRSQQRRLPVIGLQGEH